MTMDNVTFTVACIVSLLVIVVMVKTTFFPRGEVCSICHENTKYEDLACSESQGFDYWPVPSVCKKCWEQERIADNLRDLLDQNGNNRKHKL